MICDLDLMAQQAQTLYQLDGVGRLLAVNEDEVPAPPRLFVGRTTAGNLWHTRYDLPASLVAEIDALLATEPPATNLQAPLHCEAALRDLLNKQAPITGEWSGPAWWCPEGIAGKPHVVAVQLTDNRLLQANFPGWARDFAVSQPCGAVVVDGAAVAVCCSARVSAVAAEAGVNTAEAYRGRGYAAAAVAAWAAAVRASGRLPLYSTSWDNVASQGVARTLGLRLYGADRSFT